VTALELVNRCLRATGRSGVTALPTGSMSSVLETSLDLIDVLFLQRGVDAAHRFVVSLAPWEWTKTKAEIAVLGRLRTTVSCVGGSDSFVLLDPAESGDYSGSAIRFGGSTTNREFPVASVTGTAGTFALPWPDATGDYSADLLQGTYDLPTNMSRPGRRFCYSSAPEELHIWSVDEIQRERRRSAGDPTACSVWGSRAGTTEDARPRSLLLAPYPSAATTLTILYHRMAGDLLTDSTVPDVPARHQEVLIDLALSKFYRDGREPDRLKWMTFDQSAKNHLAIMLAEYGMATDRPQMVAVSDRGHFGGRS